jgi:hypothetical protein
MVRKIVGRVIVLVGVSFAFVADWLCRGGAWLADIDWADNDEPFYKGGDVMFTDMVMNLVRQEREKQDEKWGPIAGRAHDTLDGDWITILAEEVGEAAHEVLEGQTKKAVDELVQVAAVAVAHIEAIRNICGNRTK